MRSVILSLCGVVLRECAECYEGGMEQCNCLKLYVGFYTLNITVRAVIAYLCIVPFLVLCCSCIVWDVIIYK